MPVQGIQPGLLEIGKIKIGIKGKEITSTTGTKFRPPVKLDHFIITTSERNDEGDFLLDTDLMNRIKENKNAKLDAKGNIVGIPIRLLYNDIDLCFPTRWLCYKGAKLSWYSNDGITMFTRDKREVRFNPALVAPGYDGPDRGKINGRLSVIIEGADTFGGCWVFRTTSKNTVQSVLGSLAAIRHATGGRLAFLPLMLTVQPKTTTIPSTGAHTTVHVVSVIFPGSIEELQQKSITMARDNAKYLVELKSVEDEARNIVDAEVLSEEDERDFAQEFFPEQAEKEINDKTASPPEAAQEEPVEGPPQAETPEHAETETKEPTFEDVPPEDVAASKPKFELNNPDDPADPKNWLNLKSSWPEFVEKYKDVVQAAPATIRAKFISKWKRMPDTRSEDCPVTVNIVKDSKGSLHDSDRKEAPEETTEEDPQEAISGDIEEKPTEDTDATGEPATRNDLFNIVMLKKACKIVDVNVWNKLVEPYGVKTAKDMTHAQAKKFIAELENLRFNPELLPT